MSSLKYNLSSLQVKAKERTVKTQSVEYDLEGLVKKIDRGIIKLDPDYQRRHRWDDKTSSRLIESLILNIPIPIVYISQDVDVDTELNSEEARYSVIDGQQRLTAMYRFYKNKFPLVGLDALDELNGCYFNDLPPFLTRRLEERSIKGLRIDSTLDEQVKIDIFERLNSGSVKLEPQELRNAVYSGKFNNLCKDLSTNPSYRILLQISEESSKQNNRVKKMEDVELVLRFFSLINGNYLNYKKTKDKGFVDFLSDFMKQNNDATDDRLLQLRSEFETTMEVILAYFGSMAFAKYKYEKTKFVLQSKFNIAVFDALATSCHDLIHGEGLKNFSNKYESFHELFRNSDFYHSVTGSSLDTAKLRFRIEETKKVLQ